MEKNKFDNLTREEILASAPEDIDQLKKEWANYRKATQDERNKKRQAEKEFENQTNQYMAELEELRKFKQELEEKEAKKK